MCESRHEERKILEICEEIMPVSLGEWYSSIGREKGGMAEIRESRECRAEFVCYIEIKILINNVLMDPRCFCKCCLSKTRMCVLMETLLFYLYEMPLEAWAYSSVFILLIFGGWIILDGVQQRKNINN